jgi:hypothetical protein
MMEDYSEYSSDASHLIGALLVCCAAWALLNRSIRPPTEGVIYRPSAMAIIGGIGLLISFGLTILQQFSVDVGYWNTAFVKAGIFSLILGASRAVSYDEGRKDGFEAGRKFAFDLISKGKLNSAGPTNDDAPSEPRRVI